MTEQAIEYVDTIVTSDWHMGSALCKGQAILTMMRAFKCRRIVLLGDILDDRLDLHRLKRGHFDLLSF